MMSLKSLLSACLLLGAANAADHSTHNCCMKSASGQWQVADTLTQAVCAAFTANQAAFDGIKCRVNVSGDAFYNKCIQLSGLDKGVVGAGYRGTC
ncbi:hypothetical protein F53441_12915 [Fusarium austroafricanum]|uniref:Uncharacterized protein n=1 Tax=Fusarium austroafricanum TaxID=2364996 RepID=A0A8H4NHC6_9HYPO|nr:hypothetical protein F53441_12915 [Fusarium austroafricanum]